MHACSPRASTGSRPQTRGSSSGGRHRPGRPPFPCSRPSLTSRRTSCATERAPPPRGGVPVRDQPLPNLRVHVQARADTRRGLWHPAQDRRRALDARLVEALERRADDLIVERVERLAHHAFRGGVWDKAVTYSREAGTRAFVRSAYRTAVRVFRAGAQGAPAPSRDSRDPSVRASICAWTCGPR